jgi:purine nucleosidase
VRLIIDYEALAALPTEAGRFFRETTRQGTENLRRLPRDTGFLLPDPLAMAVALEPGLIRRSEFRYVTVEVQGTHTRGQTVIDYRGATGRVPNVHLALDVDIDGAHRLFERMLAERNPRDAG